VVYQVLWPLFPLIGALGLMTTTERVGRAMLRVVREGSPRPILSNADINRLGTEP